MECKYKVFTNIQTENQSDETKQKTEDIACDPNNIAKINKFITQAHSL